MDTRVDDRISLETVMKRGALVCVVAMGGVAVGLAIWALRRWHDERAYQAWRASLSADPYRRDRNGYPVGAPLRFSPSRERPDLAPPPSPGRPAPSPHAPPPPA